MKPVTKRGILKRRFLGVCLAFLMIAIPAFPAAAAAAEPVVLRVPFPEVPGFTMLDEQGHH